MFGQRETVTRLRDSSSGVDPYGDPIPGSVDTAGGGTVHLAWCSLNLRATYCSCGADIAGYPIFEGA